MNYPPCPPGEAITKRHLGSRLLSFLLCLSLWWMTPCHAHAIAPSETKPIPKGGELRLAALSKGGALNPYSFLRPPVVGLDTTFSTLCAPLDDISTSITSPTCQPYTAASVAIDRHQNTITYHLDKRARFHDGTPVEPKDVVASLNFLRREGSTLHKGSLKAVASIREGACGDPHHPGSSDKMSTSPLQGQAVVFEIDPAMMAPLSLDEMAYIIGTVIKILKADEVAQVAQPHQRILTGSGPYKIIHPVPDNAATLTKPFDKIIYQRVKDWWGENLPHAKDRYNFDSISYTFFGTTQATFQALKAGQIDARLEWKADQWHHGYDFPLVKEGKLKKISAPMYRPRMALVHLFNMRKPKFQDKRLRQALALLMDFPWLNQHYFRGEYHRMTSYFQGTPYASLQPPYSPLSPREARVGAATLLSQAGWAQDERGQMVNVKTGEPLRLSILVPSPSYVRILAPFVGHLKHMGIDVFLDISDSATRQHKRMTGDFDIAAGEAIHHPVFPKLSYEAYWRSTWASANLASGPYNVGGVSDPALDLLLDNLKAAKSQEELMAILQTIDAHLVAAHYGILLWYPHSIHLAAANWIGFPECQEGVIDVTRWWDKRSDNRQPIP